MVNKSRPQLKEGPSYPHQPYNCLLRWPDVQKRIGLSKSYVYHLISLGAFPQPIKLGPRASGWLESEVNAWIEHRIAESRPQDSLGE